MTETPTPPEQTKSNRWRIVVEAIICALAVLSVPTLLIPFIMIPVAFAFPIIVGRPKLLFIPAGAAGAGLIVLLFVEVSVIPLLLLLLAIIGAFGVGAGLLARRFRKSQKCARILATITGVVILLVPFLFVADMFTGLLRYPFVCWRIHSYVARNYSDFDLTVNSVNFDFKGNDFNAQIHDSNNADISFHITHRGGAIHDGFTSGSFWAGTINYILTPLLEEEFGDEFHKVTPSISGVQSGFTSSVVGVQVGQPFDLTADVEKTARIIVVTESADPDILAAQISRYHAFISQNGFDFSQYMFHFQYANAPPVRGNERVIDISLQSELINDDLPALIEHARNNRNHNGVFHTTEFRYVSRVDFTSPVE